MMPRAQYILFAILITLGADLFAQKTTTNLEQFWVAYANQTRFSKRWGIWADFHLRTKDHFFTDLSQSIIRPGITYYVNNNVKLTAGYAYVTIYPADNHAFVARPEHRPWQQVQWHTNAKKSRTMQWVRLEERYRRKIKNPSELADGYNFNYRLRYNYLLTFPLGKKSFAPGALSGVVNNEIHINFGKEVRYNTFDQNRFFLGFAYHVTDNANIQFGYMNLYQQLAAGDQYRMIHAARVFYFHNIDLRKKSS